jgi:hypothetical protein
MTQPEADVIFLFKSSLFTFDKLGFKSNLDKVEGNVSETVQNVHLTI